MKYSFKSKSSESPFSRGLLGVRVILGTRPNCNKIQNGFLIYRRLSNKVRTFSALHKFFAKWWTCNKKVTFLTEYIENKALKCD